MILKRPISFLYLAIQILCQNDSMIFNFQSKYLLICIFFSTFAHKSRYTMKKFIYSAIYFCLLFCSCAPSAPLSLHWELLCNDVEPGICEAHLTITNTSRDTLTNQGWTLYFNLMSLHPIYTEGDALRETEIQASWHSIEPTQTFAPLAPGESRTFTLRYKGSAIRENICPEGFFLIQNSKFKILNS